MRVKINPKGILLDNWSKKMGLNTSVACNPVTGEYIILNSLKVQIIMLIEKYPGISVGHLKDIIKDPDFGNSIDKLSKENLIIYEA